MKNLCVALPVVFVSIACFGTSDESSDNVDVGDGDGECQIVGDPEPNPVRNPETGDCTDSASPIVCGEAPPVTVDELWGSCESECTDLDEVSCKETANCRAIYVNGCFPLDCVQWTFAACWQTGLAEPSGDACATLDATECSFDDTCAAVHDNTTCWGENLPSDLDPLSCIATHLGCVGEDKADDWQ